MDETKRATKKRRVTMGRLERLAELARCSISRTQNSIVVRSYRGAWEEEFNRLPEAAAFLRGLVRGMTGRQEGHDGC